LILNITSDCGNILIIRGTFGVDCLGLLWTAKTFLPAMVSKNHGHFLIIASQTSHLATASIVDYGATKAAALAIYEGLQSEMKHFYSDIIRISCIQLSAVTTKMFTGIKSASNFFLPRLEPEDVGDSIAETLWSGEARNLMIPALAYISPPTRALPEWMRVAMQDGAATVFTELKPHNPMDGKP
jgi:all-trans-retinol dehydrogenase (NAD+)